MEVHLRLGSAQMSLHRPASWRVTLFPVTFSAINLQTYSDGVPLRGLRRVHVAPVLRWRRGRAAHVAAIRRQGGICLRFDPLRTEGVIVAVLIG